MAAGAVIELYGKGLQRSVTATHIDAGAFLCKAGMAICDAGTHLMLAGQNLEQGRIV